MGGRSSGDHLVSTDMSVEFPNPSLGKLPPITLTLWPTFRTELKLQETSNFYMFWISYAIKQIILYYPSPSQLTRTQMFCISWNQHRKLLLLKRSRNHMYFCLWYYKEVCSQYCLHIAHNNVS